MVPNTNVSAPTAVGIDIGGSGVKAAAVDVQSGSMTTDRVREPTPDPPTPERTVDAILGLLDDLDAPAQGPVGVGFPGVIRDGVIKTAANLDASWVDLDGVALFSEKLGRPAHLINDADAAGLAEVRFGAGAGVGGVVLMLTLGTGIGSGLFNDGTLVPNTEFGHLDMGGQAAEARASSAVRKKRGLSWKKWGREVDLVLAEVERLFWPDLIIIGGGVSRRFDEFSSYFERDTPIVPAALGNNAGIIGAALWAADKETT
jgi:polyphosphate glucokinase